MGEYGTLSTGERVKLGTCEDMYYLRWDQRGEVLESDTPLDDREVLEVIRFRFPFPDEDGTEPGAFEPFRGLTLWGFEQPAEVEHGSVQFKAANGYLTSLPCPEGPNGDSPEYVIHRNGYGGPAELVQQGWRRGSGDPSDVRLVGIARCKGCGAAYRLEDEHGLEARAAILEQANQRIKDRDRYNAGHRIGGEMITGDNGAGFYLETARRLARGYELELGEVLADA